MVWKAIIRCFYLHISIKYSTYLFLYFTHKLLFYFLIFTILTIFPFKYVYSLIDQDISGRVLELDTDALPELANLFGFLFMLKEYTHKGCIKCIMYPKYKCIQRCIKGIHPGMKMLLGNYYFKYVFLLTENKPFLFLFSYLFWEFIYIRTQFITKNSF
uniref:Uncharacterized protein n=1 Tax=Meloidogyne enterolobii TaxID=390850 RepID=A0A6V7TNG0_MELEN|nr:unnamed protein product [Meloidogyne enterolobii]